MTDKTKQPARTGLEIAVIGMAGRFPKARDLAAFWRNLQSGQEAVTFFTDEELLAAGVNPELLNHPQYVKAKSIMDDVDRFDASFFGYTPREAEVMDPQMRLFHECVHEALEDSGYDPDQYRGTIGLFAGASANLYWQLISMMSRSGDSAEQFASLSLTDKDFMNTRLAHKLGLRGPCVTVDTACSTSLVAIHLACRALLTGDCKIAIAGGATVMVPHENGYLYREGMIHSPDGHCRAFDAQAGGTVGGEGVGAVVLKPLKQALADRDHIYAVIKGSAINNDGTRKMAYTAPSIEGQADVIRAAQRLARVEPETVTYVEAHGTGTKLGDPVEMEALRLAFRTEDKQYCAVGSVKTNIGHLDAAAGVAGFIKTVLALHHKELPPSLHYQEPNPKIDFANSPFFINDKLRPWPGERGPRRAGVSSFGIGGTNAHVILEEAPAAEQANASDNAPHLFLLSAKTESALARSVERLKTYLEQTPHANLADIAYTLQVGRKSYPYRRLFVAGTREEALAKLATPDALPAGHEETSRRSVTFLFSGQGAQYVEMGLGLYEREPVFREELDRCLGIAAPLVGNDLREMLFPTGDRDAASEQMRLTQYTQPLLFLFEYALARWLMGLGVQPTAMIGHSIGEYVAACLAGVFTLEDALRLVILRGRYMAEMPPGAMLSVPLSEAEVLPLLGDDLSLAAVNAPAMTVVSGPHDAIERLTRELTAAGHQVRALHTSHAFHSAMMEPMLAKFEAEVRAIVLQKPALPFLSNVTGTWITDEQATDPTYWTQQLRGAVRFADGLAEVLKDERNVLVEVGPGRTLCTFVRKHPARLPSHAVVPLVRHPQDQQDDMACVLEGVGRLWMAGVAIDWAALASEQGRSRLPLPTYPFEGERYWIETKADLFQSLEDMIKGRSEHTTSRASLDDWFYLPSWERVAATGSAEGTALEGACLVLLDKHGFGQGLADRLRERGVEVVQSLLGDEGNYVALLKELSTQGKRIATIVHPGGIGESVSDTAWEEGLSDGYLNVLGLARAIGAREASTGELRLIAVGSGMQDVTGEEEIDPSRATLLGACQVIPAEYAGVRCTAIDLAWTGLGATARQRLLDATVAEILAPSGAEVVACRGAHRFVQTFKPARFPLATPLRQAPVCLITGGLGGIGLTLGEHLAKTAGAKLVLTARSAFPERADWDAWVAGHGEEDRISRRIRRLQQIEATGGEVLVLTADASDPTRTTEAVRLAKERFGALHGVIHAAGVPDGALIMRRTPEIERSAMEAKVQGMTALEAALHGTELDFLLLCSSLATVTAPIGQAGYCAANHVLNAYAHRLQRQGIPAVAVNWDGWSDVGMAAEAEQEVAAAMAAQTGTRAGTQLRMSPAEGAAVFERLLLGAPPQVMISTHDLTARLLNKHRIDLAAPNGQTPSANEVRGTITLAAGDLEQTIIDVFADFFGLPSIGVHDNFFELGASSLDLVQINGKLQTKLGIEFPVVTLFTYPTVHTLAKALRPEDTEANEAPKQDRTEKIDDGKNRLKQRMNRRR